jgi:L-ornithine N5-monooxygenase
MLRISFTNFYSVNEIFDPERSSHFYNGPADARADALRADRSTNYSVVRLELLEQIYQDLYQQRIKQTDETRWQHRILRSREVTEISRGGSKNGARLLLTIKNIDPLQGSANSQQETLEVDAVILATGYVRNVHEKLLTNLEHLRPRAGDHWRVRRDYKVEMDNNKVNPDAGIWLQGCNENTHGLSDTLLSTLATRGGELVESIFGTAPADGQ